MMVTVPELAELLLLARPVNAELAKRFWSVLITSVSSTLEIIEGDAIVSQFAIIDAGVGFGTIEMTLDFVTGTVAPSSSASVIP